MENIAIKGALTVLAVITMMWGFERYRTRFVRSDLLIAGVVAVALLATAYVPAIFDAIGSIFDLQRRVVALSFVGNIGLLLLVLYLGTLVRELREDLTELTRNVTLQQTPKADGGRANVNVIIPAYNEAETISKVLTDLPERVCGYSVHPIVVSDGSTDNTARVAQEHGAEVAEHPVNQGQGGALKTGFELAIENDAEVVVTMDADGQHPAEDLERLVGPIVENEADFVMGSRYLGSNYSGNGPVRRAGIYAFTRLINVLTKSGITDCTNGYRAIRGSELPKLTLTEERFNAPELIIEARKNGLRVKEIPITIEERQAGETKKPQLGYAFGLTRTILITWIR